MRKRKNTNSVRMTESECGSRSEYWDRKNKSDKSDIKRKEERKKQTCEQRNKKNRRKRTRNMEDNYWRQEGMKKAGKKNQLKRKNKIVT
jgi:hypothetical protein